MKTKHYLHELVTQRQLLVDYLRSNEESLTMDKTLKLCNEISSLTERIDSFNDMPFRKGEEEISLYTSMKISSINNRFAVAVPRKKKKKVPVIPSTRAGLSYF